MGKVIGIDLGTTNSVVAVVREGDPEVITNPEGSRLTPSVVAFNDKGERFVGQMARRQAVLNPKNTVHSVKRLIGRTYEEVAEEVKRLPYEVRKKGNGVVVHIPATDRDYPPEEISAMILQKLKATAEEFLGEEVTKAVITVPAYFNDSQRQSTRDAGRIAGLEVLRIINEPTAASLAYGLDKKEDETILVWDLGGGTFDVSILEVGDGVFEVKATNGDTHLGGDDYDQKIVEYLLQEFRKDTGIDLSGDAQAMQRLRDAAEKAKIELSSSGETTIQLPFITADAQGPKHLEAKLTRAKFEELTSDLTERMVGPFKQALEDAGLKVEDLDEVIFVGGATRMPQVQALVERLTGKKPHKGVNPDEVVAIGAAIQGAVLAGEIDDVVLLDVTPLSLGIETLGGVTHKLIPRNTTIPTRKSEIFTTAEDNQTAVDIHVVQGEREMARDNRTLGRFRLEGIPPAPRGVPQIEVTFDIDANGIVNVSAKDLGTGKEQRITVTASTQLSEEEIERMVKEAEEKAEEDRKARERVETRNQADSLAYQTEKALKDAGDRLSESDRRPVEEAIKQLREALEKDDIEEIKRKMEVLKAASAEMSQKLYSSASGGAQTGGQSGAAGQQGSTGQKKDDDDVIDVDYEES